jgi:hypothetical protein
MSDWGCGRNGVVYGSGKILIFCHSVSLALPYFVLTHRPYCSGNTAAAARSTSVGMAVDNELTARTWEP